jgi:3'-phosphoadenosine 5'-phosphosulfate sulfotransferase (PAPS reductase)/FAD synthetase
MNDLYDKVKKRSDRLLMSFSCGADSIAMFLRVMESGEFAVSDGVYFYYWFLPGVPWVEDYIDYFEDRYGVKIIKLPNPIFVNDQGIGFLKTPVTAAATAALQKTPYRYWKNDKSMLERAVKVNQGLPQDTLTAVGIKQGDSAMRRITLRKNGGISESQGKWYPIHDYENRDVYEIIKRHGVKVPYDYELFGISFENMDYRFSSVIRDRCPETWEILKYWYPQIEMYIARHERYHPEWEAKKGVMWRKLDVLEPRRAL